MRFSRMLQQAARFTLHLPGAEPLKVFPPEQVADEGPPRTCSAYDVPSHAKAELLQELRGLNVDWASLFPELDYVAREVRAEFGLFPP